MKFTVNFLTYLQPVGIRGPGNGPQAADASHNGHLALYCLNAAALLHLDSLLEYIFFPPP